MFKAEMGQFRFRNRNWNRNLHFFHVGGIGIGIESTNRNLTTVSGIGIGIGIECAGIVLSLVQRQQLYTRSQTCTNLKTTCIPAYGSALPGFQDYSISTFPWHISSKGPFSCLYPMGFTVINHL